MIVFLLTLMAILGIFWQPYDANEVMATRKLLPPSWDHWFGTDNFGRDIFSRVLVGTVNVYIIGMTSVFIGLVGGLIMGAIAGYFGGWVDEVIMRITDAMMAIPGILFAIMLISIFDTGFMNTIVALGVPRIATFTRVIRAGFLQIKPLDYVKSSIIKGSSNIHIIRHHILPNIFTQILVAVSLSFSSTILSESGLSYLGLGVQPPHASWGRMLSEAKPYLLKAPWYITSVGIMITLMVLGFNLLADGIRKQNDKRGN